MYEHLMYAPANMVMYICHGEAKAHSEIMNTKKWYDLRHTVVSRCSTPRRQNVATIEVTVSPVSTILLLQVRINVKLSKYPLVNY